MEDKTQGLITRITTYTIVFLGVLFTLWVMNDDNPAEMSYEQQKQWAIVEAKENFEDTVEVGGFIIWDEVGE